MDRHDKVAEAFRLLGEALPGERWLETFELRAVSRANHIDREDRAQALLPFGRGRAATMLDCSERHVYYLAERARERIIETKTAQVATGAT